MTDEIQHLKIHLGDKIPIEIDGKEYHFEQLDIEHFPDFMTVLSSFMSKGIGQGKTDTAQILSAFDKDTSDAAKRLVVATVEKSYPGEYNEDLRDNLLKVNSFFLLFMGIINGNSSMAGEMQKNDPDGRKASAINDVRKKIDESKQGREA